MKRFFRLILPLALITMLLFSGCSLAEASRENELQASMEATYDELTSTFPGNTGKFSLVTEYLNSWAKENKIEVARKEAGYMVMTNPATKGCEDKKSLAIQCPVKTDDFSNSFNALAVGLTALLGPEDHGDILLVVTEIDDGEMIGAESLEAADYQTDHFINLQYGDDTEVLTAGAYTLNSTMTSDIAYTEPSYSTAFAITMTMASCTDPFDFEKHYPNPIETIGSLLATEQSSGQLFQLASFDCETKDGYTPISATAVVVVDSNDIENFTKRFDRSYENVKARFDKLEDSFVYTMTETGQPERVMTSQSSDNIISLMYTLKTGIYLQDEETGRIISASDTSFVGTADGKFRMDLRSRSLEEAVLGEMSDVYLTTSGLCDISYTASEVGITWSADEDGELADFFVNSLGADDPGELAIMESSECDLFAGKAEGLDIISYRCGGDHGEAALVNVLRYTESLAK